MKPIIIHIIYLWAILLPSLNFAQEPDYFLFNADNGLPTNEVYAAYESNDGKLYIGHALGLSIYNGIEFKTIRIPGVKEGISCYGIYNIHGKVWFKFVDQLFFLEGTEIKPYKYNSVLQESKIGTIYHFTFIDNELHVSTGDKSFFIDNSGNLHPITLKQEQLKIDRKNRHIIRQLEGGIDTLWGYYNGIQFNTLNQKSPIPHFGVEFNRKDIYWNSYVLFYFKNNLIRSIHLKELIGKLTLDGNWIISVIQKNNLLYLSTKASGIVVLKLIDGDWTFETQILNKEFIGIISKSKTGIWAPIVNKGLAFIPNENIKNFILKKEVKNLYLDSSFIYVTVLDMVKNHPVKRINSDGSIVPDKDFDWTIYNYNYLDYLTKVWNKPIFPKTSSAKGIIQPIKNKYFFPSTIVNSFISDNYFIQGSNFNIAIENKHNAFKDTVLLDGILSMERLYNDSYVIGTKSGLTKFVIKKDKEYEISSNNSISGIHSIQKIDLNYLIVASSDGIYSYNVDKEKYLNLYRNSELLIRSFYLHKNLLFIGTPTYLEVIDRNTENKLILNKSNGLINANISNIVANDSILVVSHEKGVSVIPMSEITSKINRSSENYNDYLTYTLEGNSININFNYFDLNPYSKISTQYSINGEEFIDFSNQKLQLTNLQSGVYQLQVRFRISNGNWIELDPITFEIPLPFYAQWWFSASIVAFIALVIILIIRRRNQIQTKRLQTEKLIETLRMNALTSQMNPHFLYNALNTIQGLLTGDTKQVFIYVSDLARFFRLMLNNSSDIYIPIYKEIELNQIFAEIESVRQHHQVKLTINYESEELKDFIIPSMILQPFVENALWHAFPKEIENPEVQIQIQEYSSDAIKITIQDNGIGISNTKNRKKVHQSKGVSIVENRLKLFNDNNPNLSKNTILTDHSELDENQRGTNVEIYLTKHYEHDLQSDDH